VSELILAVDGGNAKTDLALVSAEGEVLSLVRGPGSSPHEHGLEGALDRIEALLAEARAPRELAIADLSMAGVDFPHEVETARRHIEQRGWARRVEVGNDTDALLRAGTDRGWGVAVVCGAGINCTGVGPDGREARFPALGDITGDWGGGYDVGIAALGAAARSEDGRGPSTSLEQLVPAHFDCDRPLDLARSIHERRIAKRRLIELAPLVLSTAQSDGVSRSIVDRLVAEVVAIARTAVRRLGLVESEVVVGGGLMRSADDSLLRRVADGLGEGLTLRRTSTPPIVGAALLGLDEAGAGAVAQERLRRELCTAIERLETGQAA
jgi:N-acetylglucosamine kinase-like BadF-type ATPase